VTTLPAGSPATPGAPSKGASGWLFGPDRAVRVAILAAAFVALFFRWIMTQAAHSAEKPEDWGHAFIIPLISGYMVWRDRERIARLTPRVFWPALSPFLLGIGAYFFCVVGVRNHMLQGFSVILTLYSLILFLTGPAIARFFFLPAVYLVFAVTIAEIIMIKITFPLQLFAAQGAWAMLSIIALFGGFTVDVSGNVLKMITSTGNEIPLNVAEQCSGMRMVIAFYALAGAVALLSCKSWWQRVAVMLLAAPVAVFMNVIRVGVLGLATLVDPKFTQGDAHMLIGTLLLVPGLFLFMGCVWALERIIVPANEGAASKGASA
jgi:exosortase